MTAALARNIPPVTADEVRARLSAWARASMLSVRKRADAVALGAATYADHVGRRTAERPLVRTPPEDRLTLLYGEPEDLGLLAAQLLPDAVRQTSRLLWVDEERLRDHLETTLRAHLDAARHELKRTRQLISMRGYRARELTAVDRAMDMAEALRVPREVSARQIISRLSEMLARQGGQR